MGPGRANPSFKCRLLLMKLKSFPESWGLWEGKKLCGKGGIEHWHGQQLTFGLYQQSGSRQQRVQYCFLRVSLCCSSQAHSPFTTWSGELGALCLPSSSDSAVQEFIFISCWCLCLIFFKRHRNLLLLSGIFQATLLPLVVCFVF